MRYLYEKKMMNWIPTSYHTQKSISGGFKPKCKRQNNNKKKTLYGVPIVAQRK